MPRRDVPDRLGPYSLGEVLGMGTVGTVYRAVNVEDGTPAAVKVLHPHVAADEEIAARFEREIEILRRLSHPNVVACLDSGRADADGKPLPAAAKLKPGEAGTGRWYYVMELVDAGTLKDLLAAKRVLDWEDVVEIGWQLCSALQHLHNNGVVHRDLKPSNVYFTPDGQAKLGDFGVALDTAAAGLTQQGKTVGTWLYMSPEQIRGKSLDAKTDLYALGCLLYECLTGKPPFTGAGFADIFEQHLRQPPPPVRSLAHAVPRELDALVGELLAKSPRDRPLNARAVQGRLAEALMKQEEAAAAKADAAAERKAKGRGAGDAGGGTRSPDIWAVDPPRRALGGLIAEARRQPAARQAGWGTVAAILAATAAALAAVAVANAVS